nr:L10-interacting MYB domain-containing protein-like [Ipomoea batatas]
MSKGNKGGVTSKRLKWKKIELEFNNQSNLAWDKNKLKNKVDWMKSRWSLWKQLKAKETGLGWDHVKATISANDEWWAMKIKENFKFDSFRDEGIEPELENRMDQIFGSYAQGKYKFSPVANSPHEQEVYVPSPPHRNDEHVSLDDMDLNHNGDDNYYGGAS